MKTTTRTLFALLATASVSIAQVPQMINYQGRVAVNGINFDGIAQFKFSLVDGAGTTTFWSNDGTGASGGAPTASVPLLVQKGLYSVLLGDATLSNMTVVSSSVFTNQDVRLRVWFDDGAHGWQQLSPDQRIAAVGYAMMSAGVPDEAITSSKIADGAVGSAQIAAGAVGAIQLTPGAAISNLNAGGLGGVAVGGIVLSEGENTDLAEAGYVKIAEVTLSDPWYLRATNSPSPRWRQSAIWTGSEMILWGGQNASEGIYFDLANGLRYHPGSNSWTAVATNGAPVAFYRCDHTAVWTGSKMIIWGGGRSTGGCYDPATDSWISTSTNGSPSARAGHTAVWTGSEMIIWGGEDTGGQKLDDGGRYNPTSNFWSRVPAIGAPSARSGHTAVWTGSEMIIWGGNDASGYSLGDGRRYNPISNRWTSLSSTGAPSARCDHTAVWTGSEMIVWGGTYWEPLQLHKFVDRGARYDPTSNSWTIVGPDREPSPRTWHTAVWTGSEMIVWGGFSDLGLALSSGARYSPLSDAWTEIAPGANYQPQGRGRHSAVWTGSEMIVAGGAASEDPNTIDRYLENTFSYRPRIVFLYQRQ